MLYLADGKIKKNNLIEKFQGVPSSSELNSEIIFLENKITQNEETLKKLIEDSSKTYEELKISNKNLKASNDMISLLETRKSTVNSFKENFPNLDNQVLDKQRQVFNSGKEREDLNYKLTRENDKQYILNDLLSKLGAEVTTEETDEGSENGSQSENKIVKNVKNLIDDEEKNKKKVKDNIKKYENNVKNLEDKLNDKNKEIEKIDKNLFELENELNLYYQNQVKRNNNILILSDTIEIKVKSINRIVDILNTQIKTICQQDETIKEQEYNIDDLLLKKERENVNINQVSNSEGINYYDDKDKDFIPSVKTLINNDKQFQISNNNGVGIKIDPDGTVNMPHTIKFSNEDNKGGYLKHDDLTGSLHIRSVKTDNGIEIDKEGNLIVDNKLCIKADIDNEGKYYNINKTGKYNFLEFKGENYYCFSKNKVILDSYAVYATLKNSIDSRLNTLSLETTPDTNGSRQTEMNKLNELLGKIDDMKSYTSEDMDYIQTILDIENISDPNEEELYETSGTNQYGLYEVEPTSADDFYNVT